MLKHAMILALEKSKREKGNIGKSSCQKESYCQTLVPELIRGRHLPKYSSVELDFPRLSTVVEGGCFLYGTFDIFLSMKKLKDVDFKILSELIKNSKMSDRKLANLLGVSQPTVTRRRAMLEREKLLDYTAIPNLEKLGFEILAIAYARWNHEACSDEKESEAKAFLSRHPNVLFVSTGRGLGMDRVLISVHRSYTDYAEFMKDLKEEWGNFFASLDAFIVSLRGDNVLRQLTFKSLANCLLKREEREVTPSQASR
jgi:DNA-binding Lrp family transcriptional regulator